MSGWQGRWWCTFREAAGHVGGDGAIRVITSKDDATWESAAALAEKDADLRDPKLSVAPDGRRSRVSFSNDGKIWSAPEKILEEGDCAGPPQKLAAPSARR